MTPTAPASPQGHRLRRPQLRRRRPRRRRAAGRRAARRLRDRRPQDLRPRLRRDDLLGRRARPRRRPRRHHRAARRRRRARPTTRAGSSAWTTSVIEFEINPDRAYALSLRGIAREVAGLSTCRFARPGRCATSPRPTTTATRSWSTTRPAARCSSLATVTGFDPTAPTPGVDAPPADRRRACAPSRLAVDVTNYVMLETRPADPRLRPRPRCTGPIRVRRATRGGAAHHPRRRHADPDRRRPARSPTTPVRSASPRSWAAPTPRFGDGTTSVLLEAAHWEPTGIVPHRAVGTSCPARRPSASSAASTRR